MSYSFDLNTFTDHRGSLTVAEERVDVPFAIKRTFWLYDSDDFRGRHSHKRCRQLLVCVAGTVVVNVRNEDGLIEYCLDRPDLALYLEPEEWREVEMSEGSVVLVLCSEPFNEDDYVRIT